MPREASVQIGARAECDDRGAEHIKLNPSNGNGQPDLLACHRGITVVAELKQPGEHPSAIQRHRLWQWAAAGAVAGVVRSRADMAELLDLAEELAAHLPPRTTTGRLRLPPR